MRLSAKLFLGSAALAAAAVTVGTPAHVSAADFFEGKTITMIVGRGAGSGADATARSFAKYWKKYIPGNPTIVAKNMKGTASWNFMYQKAKPDGMTVSFTPYDPAAQLTKVKGFNARYDKMPFVGSLYNPPLVYVRTTALKSAADLKSMKGAKYGGQQPTGRFDVMGRITLDLLGADYKYATGMGNSGKVLNAMRRGEVDIQTIGLNVYTLRAKNALINDGKAIPLYHFPWPGSTGIAKSIFGDIPSFDDYYQKIHGKAPSGKTYDMFKWMTNTLNAMSYSAFLPPNTPEEPVKILRAAYEKVVNDPEYLAEQKKQFGFNLPYIDPKTGATIVNNMVTASAEQEKFLLDFLAEGARHRIKKK